MSVRSTAIHEAGHAVVAEELGIRVSGATAVRYGDALGSTSPADLLPKSPDSIVVMLAGYHAQHAQGLVDDGYDGHREDFAKAERLLGRWVDSETERTDAWQDAHARAYELVRDPRIAHTIERLAEELIARAERGFGVSSLRIGEVIAAAHEEFDAPLRLYGAPVPRSTLNRCTPSEEIAKRKALLKRIGADTTVKPKRKPAPVAPKRKVAARTNAAPGCGSPGGYIAIETFVVLIDGQRETVKAGQTWVCNGHDLARRYPGKFEATKGHAKPSSAKPKPVAA